MTALARELGCPVATVIQTLGLRYSEVQTTHLVSNKAAFYVSSDTTEVARVSPDDTPPSNELPIDSSNANTPGQIPSPPELDLGEPPTCAPRLGEDYSAVSHNAHFTQA